MANAMEDFAKELEELVADPGPQQASASAAAQPNEPNKEDPVYQADAWGKHHREQRLASQQAQSSQPSGTFPQRPQRTWNQPFIGATHGGQQGQQAWQSYQAPFGYPGDAPQVNHQQMFGQARWPPPAEAAPAAIPGLVFPQAPQGQQAQQAPLRSPAPQHEPGRVVLSNVPGSEVGNDLLRRMIGPEPINMDHPQVNQFYNHDRGDKDPIPKWNGTHIAKMLKPWCRDLRLWRAETSVPHHKHGLKLFRSFEAGSWMKSAADRVPEETLVTGDAWRLIMLEILKVCKPYLDVETELVIEETLFTTQKDPKETMTSYLTRKLHKRRDLVSALGHRKISCAQCSHCTDEPVDLPEKIWTYLLKRDARLT